MYRLMKGEHVRQKMRLATLGLVAAAVVVLGLPAEAGHTTDPRTNNMHPKGHIVEPASLLNPAVGNPDIHTDIAFWDQLAIQGNWDGFNIRDISDPDNPTQVSRTFCDGNQGDVVVWENIIVRSWNSNAPGNTFCDGELVPAGFEGLHVFDASDLSDPELVASVDLPQGSHTATGVPDLENDRLLIYNSASSGANPGLDIVEVPVDDPASAAFLRFEPAGRSCHDTGVILGDAMLAACAGGNGWTLWDISADLEDPVQVHSQAVPTVTIGHSAAFSFDGDTLVFGHEPGGGVAAECEATDDPLKRSFFFYDTDDATDDGTTTGTLQGIWTLPRTQSSTENCSLHNYNVVPLRSGRDVVVHGSYQSGTSVVDFTDRANAVELGWSDPPPIVPPDLGGAWSSYWYNNFIHETNITEGLNIFRFSGRETAGAMHLNHLNPQTQELTIDR
jgi:hypothetical protein